jgi:hypothetical protein
MATAATAELTAAPHATIWSTTRPTTQTSASAANRLHTTMPAVRLASTRLSLRVPTSRFYGSGPRAGAYQRIG